MATKKNIEEILYHRFCYYVLMEPEIEDWQYDLLEKKMTEEEKEKLGVGSSLETSYPNAAAYRKRHEKKLKK